MSSDIFFEDAEETTSAARPKKAFFAINPEIPENEEVVLKWLIGEKQFLEDMSNRQRFRLMRDNLSLYKGIPFELAETRRDIRDRSVDRSRVMSKIVVNHLFDLTQNRAARLVKFKPAVSILPTNDEFGDKNAAKATEDMLSHIWYIEDFEGQKVNAVATESQVLGESYLWIDWDPDKGDTSPASPKDGEKVILLDENGKPEKDANDNVVTYDKEVKVGDVDYEVVLALDILLERTRNFQNSNYCFRRMVMKVEEARAKWPDAADKISGEVDSQIWDFELMQLRPAAGDVVMWEFYHKKTPQLPGGRRIIFQTSNIIVNEDHPYSHGDFPFERYTDVDLPGEIHAVSFFETIKELTRTYDNLTNIALKNQYLVSHPKWMMPAGAASLQSLGNDITIVQYKGPIAPQLVQMNPTPPEIFTFRQEMKEDFQQIAGVFGVSRGEPPPGVKAGVALQFLNEQENERFNQDIVKWNAFIKNVAIKTLSVVGDFYDASDDRMLRVLGKDGIWRTRFFDSANLSKDYDIRIQNSSALPQSRAARIQTLIDLSERFPDLFTQEQVLDMLDLGQSEKFMDQGTVAVRSAQAEDELILSGEKTAGVKEWEDHIQHWKTHVSSLNSWSFKEDTPKKEQDNFKNHILLHEYYMAIKAQKSPAFAEKLSLLDQYPLFFEAGESLALQQIDQSVAPGAAGAQPVPSTPIAAEPQLPVNPELGGEEQLGAQDLAAPVVPSGEALPPEPGPVEPSAAI